MVFLGFSSGFLGFVVVFYTYCMFWGSLEVQRILLYRRLLGFGMGFSPTS